MVPVFCKPMIITQYAFSLTEIDENVLNKKSFFASLSLETPTYCIRQVRLLKKLKTLNINNLKDEMGRINSNMGMII